MVDLAVRHQRLPSAGPGREALREKGQFWTPEWVAEAMVAYALRSHPGHVFDPAVGAGAFFRAAKVVANEMGQGAQLMGCEVDPAALQQARGQGLTEADLSQVHITDFVLRPPQGLFKAIVANPPYIRHHRLSKEVKKQVRGFGTRLIGRPLDGRAGLHVYFLLRALERLDVDGHLAFIMPADTCEGIFARTLWEWITRRYALEAVVTFAPEASPFPGVDTNAVVFMIKNSRPAPHFFWARCGVARTEQLKTWVLSGFATQPDEVSVHRRELSEGLATGFSRAPSSMRCFGPRLVDFARVLRGIATGANEFFLLTTEQVKSLGIPQEYLRLAVARTRDITGDEANDATIRQLQHAGRPTWLLSLDGRPVERFPSAIREYLRWGESQGIHARALISTRRPWYRMESRATPPILFSYLGRRNSRFVRNRAGVLPLTGFLCVYPRYQDPAFIEKLWEVLRHPETIANLPWVGKSYGGGAIKAEPRALEALPLPETIVSDAGLKGGGGQQHLDFYDRTVGGTFSFSREGDGRYRVSRAIVRHRGRR